MIVIKDLCPTRTRASHGIH